MHASYTVAKAGAQTAAAPEVGTQPVGRQRIANIDDEQLVLQAGRQRWPFFRASWRGSGLPSGMQRPLLRPGKLHPQRLAANKVAIHLQSDAMIMAALVSTATLIEAFMPGTHPASHTPPMLAAAHVTCLQCSVPLSLRSKVDEGAARCHRARGQLCGRWGPHVGPDD